MISNPDALTVLVAALDGHDPATTITDNDDGTTTITASGDTSPSDLDLTVRDLLDATHSPAQAVTEVARASVSVLHATAIAMGYPVAAVSPSMVADVLREALQGAREGDAVSDDD